MRYCILILLLFFSCGLAAQVAGYRSIVATDSSRRYKPGAERGNRLYFRPIELDCWYPAKASGRLEPIRYGEFLRLFEQRAGRFQDDTVYTGLAGQVATFLCGGLGIKDTASLMGFATRSFRDAVPSPGRFPLLVYLCSYNGMCYENVRLFETLARHGYVVVSITSVGRYPGDMTMDPADLREQVADGLFAMRLLQKTGAVDVARTGLIGYSWGGPAALLLARRPAVAAVLSLDGSELHYYFGNGGEDSDFNLLRPGLVRSAREGFAYAYLESDGKQGERPADSIFDVLPLVAGPKKYVRFRGASHEDFSCLPYMGACIARKDTLLLPGYVDLAVRWFDDYLKNGHHALPADSPYPVVAAGPAHTMAVAGKVLDAVDKTPLAYVNVGIRGKNTGTVTREDGSFSLAVGAGLAKDSLTVSMAGYEPQVISLGGVPSEVLLKRRSGELAEVVVASGVRRNRILGNRSTSKVVSVGFPMRFPGSEMGVRMRVGKEARRLENFHCHVSAMSADSAVFRLNVYRVVNGNPENILVRNILLSVGKAAGDYTVDLSGMNIVVSGDILVSLELLRGYSSSPTSGAVFFSAGLFNSGTWRRPASQAEWKKARGMGVGFSVEVR